MKRHFHRVSWNPPERWMLGGPPPGGRIMLDVILDCLGALLLLGQAAWVLASKEIDVV
jgi:hypothetical protein